MNKKQRENIPQKNKVRAELQKEINSLCPFCSSSDVGHFEIHHIDEDPSNINFSNLILICPTCHSKITKREITRQMVETVKQNLPTQGNIEFIGVTIDKSCSWKKTDLPFTFYDHESPRSPFPLFNFSFINHSKRTILLCAISLRVKYLPRGLSGIPFPTKLRLSAKYRIPIPNSEEAEINDLDDQLEIPPEQAFKFQIELYESYEDKIFQIEGRLVLYFKFIFNNANLELPPIFLNCKSEDEPMALYVIS